MKHYGQFYIDGDWVEPIAQRPFELVDPSTEQVFATVALGSPADVDRAVAAARAAFPAFSGLSVKNRADLMRAIIAEFEARESDIMAAMTQEMGAPVSLKGQTGAGIAALRQAVTTLESYDFESKLGVSIIQREAIGVAGLITPWNWPIQLLCNKLSSAFAAGCTVVVKPSEFTPVSALVLAEVMHAAGVPKGVFNLVNGDGPGVGEAISSHDDIDIVSFTGSTRAGALIAAAAAPSIKRIAQELGGKSVNLILPGADLKAAADYNVTRGFSNSGQSCHSPTRILVEKHRLAELEGLLKDAVANNVRIGLPTDPATKQGPVVNRAQFDRIQAYIETGIAEGGRLVTGGPGRPKGFDRGFFCQPTIFSDVTPNKTLAREEIFGMVTVVLTYETIEEAIAIANDSPYGLGAHVFGNDRDADLDVCRGLRAGRVFYNAAPSNSDSPMGGYKKSGNGREMGVFGMEEYLEIKSIIGFG